MQADWHMRKKRSAATIRAAFFTLTKQKRMYLSNSLLCSGLKKAETGIVAKPLIKTKQKKLPKMLKKPRKTCIPKYLLEFTFSLINHLTNLKSQLSFLVLSSFRSTSIKKNEKAQVNIYDKPMQYAEHLAQMLTHHSLIEEMSVIIKYPPSGMMGCRPTLCRHEASFCLFWCSMAGSCWKQLSGDPNSSYSLSNP